MSGDNTGTYSATGVTPSVANNAGDTYAVSPGQVGTHFAAGD